MQLNQHLSSKNHRKAEQELNKKNKNSKGGNKQKNNYTDASRAQWCHEGSWSEIIPRKNVRICMKTKRKCLKTENTFSPDVLGAYFCVYS